jgi:hypothetical protein
MDGFFILAYQFRPLSLWPRILFLRIDARPVPISEIMFLERALGEEEALSPVLFHTCSFLILVLGEIRL